jgi:hypothetical protein
MSQDTKRLAKVNARVLPKYIFRSSAVLRYRLDSYRITQSK